MGREKERLERMSAHEFVRRMKSHADESDRHYTFWLGAGCSVTSGIPAAAALVRDQWLPRLYQLKGAQERSLEEWARDTYSTYDPDNLAALYGPVMNALFPLREDRQRETERLCEKGVPGFGYAILAALMSRSDGVFSGALTTNFDDLVADSMYVYGDKRPLVIQHDALSGFVRPGRVKRPLVVKVHGDHRLNPMHTSIETAELEKGIRRGIQGLLHDRGLIFVGYAGNDRGVLRALEGLPPEAIPLGVWWVSRREPTSAIREWLKGRNATWVQVDGFDELMLLFREEFEIAHPTAQKFERMIERYRETYQHLGVRVEDLPETAPDSEALKEAARNVRDTAEDWWKVDLEAQRFADSDPARADRIYREGTDRLEDARLLGNYALFLKNVRKDSDRAEEYYKRALVADPEDANNLGNYAVFLKNVRRDPDRAEEYYKRALAVNPDDAVVLGNYAILAESRKELDRAEEYYKRSLATNPEDANVLGNYADFLLEARKDPDRAEEYYKRALEADSEHANNLGRYARLIARTQEDPDRAEEYYKRALKADPEHAGVLGSYASFLLEVREDPDRAEEYYKRALKADPEHGAVLGSYANFLLDVRKDPDRAEEYHKRALATDPENGILLGNYALFRMNIRKDPDGAEEYYRRALAVHPEDANVLGNYAHFLLRVRKDPDGAEEYYKRALAADPEHANNLGNFGLLVGYDLGDPDRAEDYFERALAADPEHANNLGNYANFLVDVREDPDRAEEYYKRALAVDPKDANLLGNYGRLLLEKHNDEAAWKLIGQALDRAVEDPLRAEIYFYIVALGEKEQAMGALAELAKLVRAGVRSPGWDFSRIIERARDEGRSDVEWLELLSDVIVGRADADALDRWSEWR